MLIQLRTLKYTIESLNFKTQSLGHSHTLYIHFIKNRKFFTPFPRIISRSIPNIAFSTLLMINAKSLDQCFSITEISRFNFENTQKKRIYYPQVKKHCFNALYFCQFLGIMQFIKMGNLHYKKRLRTTVLDFLLYLIFRGLLRTLAMSRPMLRIVRTHKGLRTCLILFIIKNFLSKIHLKTEQWCFLDK